VNSYRINRGPLMLYSCASAVVAYGLALIGTGQTPVVFPTSSRKMAREIHRVLVESLGSDEGIRLIYGENSESEESQAFIAQINTELPELKALIYTPSLGTALTSPPR